MTYRLEVPLRWSDADLLGHVNHARVLTFCEEARIAFFRDAAAQADEPVFIDRGVIVARVEVDYLRPIEVATEPLGIAVGVPRVGGKSFTLSYQVTHHGEVVARALSIVVTYDYPAASSRELSPAERRLLEPYGGEAARRT